MDLKRIAAGIIVVLLGLPSTALAQQPIRDWDNFGDIDCETEMARLDNFAIQLQQEPSAKGVIVFYGGLRFRGRLPKRGEAAARAARLKPYLVQRRGIPAEQVMVINGGYVAEYQVELWVVSAGTLIPIPQPLFEAKHIKFRKGKPRPRDYRCDI